MRVIHQEQCETVNATHLKLGRGETAVGDVVLFECLRQDLDDDLELKGLKKHHGGVEGK